MCVQFGSEHRCWRCDKPAVQLPIPKPLRSFSSVDASGAACEPLEEPRAFNQPQSVHFLPLLRVWGGHFGFELLEFESKEIGVP